MNDPHMKLAFELARTAQEKLHKRRRRQAATKRCDDATVIRKPSPTQKAGTDREEQALRLLQHEGLVLLARNLSCRHGEIDLIMRDGNTLVFVEVRSRANPRFGGAAASVDRSKQQRLIRSAAFFLPGLARAYWGADTPRARFDVVAFESDAPNWLRNAFTLN